jgi:hypothetical protein
MTCPSTPRVRRRLELAAPAEDTAGPELSIVELVLFACESSEDALEVDDRVAAMIRRDGIRVLRRERDPFLRRSRG